MMNDVSFPEEGAAPATREELMTALFANMVVQQTNMALMLLGRIPHPQTGQPELDLEGARMLIDQLEMVETKTRGNLSKDEDRLLQQSLSGLRMAFVEAAGGGENEPPATSVPPSAVSSPAPPPPPPTEAESRKKFSKKY